MDFQSRDIQCVTKFPGGKNGDDAHQLVQKSTFLYYLFFFLNDLIEVTFNKLCMFIQYPSETMSAIKIMDGSITPVRFLELLCNISLLSLAPLFLEATTGLPFGTRDRCASFQKLTKVE